MMKIRSTVSVFALSLTLAACGGGAEEADDPVTPAVEETAAAPAARLNEEVEADEDASAEEPAAGAAEEEPEESAEQETVAESSPRPSASAAPAESAPVAAAPRPQMFAVCAACHSVDPGQNGLGPSLAGIFGADAGHAAGFNYSDAMEGSGLTWDEATLNRFLENPREVVPGTTMAYPGLKNAAQRQAIIDYLKGV